MDWIDLAQERDRWQTLVNSMMGFGVAYRAVNMLTS